MTDRAGQDYSLPENWGDIMELLESAKQEGIAGQPVDLLVIDTISKFTKKPYTSSFNVSDFINKIRHMNIAILFLHHEGTNGEVRGWKSGLDDMYFNLRLYREKDNDKTSGGKSTLADLVDPLILAYQCSRSGIEKNPDFEILFDKKWQEYYREDDPEFSRSTKERQKQELQRIAKYYNSKRLEHDDIYPILAMRRSNYFRLKK